MKMFAAVFKGIFSMLALIIGGGLIAWILYNELVERLPEYHRPPLASTFGIAPTMILVGVYWGRQALAYFLKRDR